MLTLFYVYYIIIIGLKRTIIDFIHNFQEFFIIVAKYSSPSIDALTPEK